MIGTRFLGIVLVSFLLNSVLHSQVTKKVVIEEITGSWCGLCPDAYVYVDSISHNYENAIAISVHQDDPMAIPLGEEVGDLYTGGGVPGFLIDRHLFDTYQFITFGLDFDLVMDHVGARCESTSPVSLSYTFAEMDDSGHVEIRVQGHFYQDVEDRELRFNLFLVEEAIAPEQEDYYQVNYFNLEEDHPFFEAGNPIQNFTHRYVLRDALGGAWGIENSIPTTSISSGSGFQQVFQFQLDELWDLKDMKMVAVVQEYNEDRKRRSFLNAEDFMLTDLLDYFENPIDTNTVSGLNDMGAIVAVDFLYPNPTSSQVCLEYFVTENTDMLVQIFDASGRLVRVLRDEPISQGAHSLHWRMDEEAPGLYFIQMESNTGVLTRRFLLR